MNTNPETRASLLLRVPNPDDQAAWEEFVEIYRPLIIRYARKRAMQQADAEDVAQRVLVNVAQAVERRPHDLSRAKFRTWLHQVANNAILNAVTRTRPDRSTGASGERHVLENTLENALEDRHDVEGPDSDLLRLEYRREMFRWAANRVRPEFKPDTWQAFWLTAVENLTIEAASQQLRKTAGAIYAARSRVIRRIREVTEEATLE